MGTEYTILRKGGLTVSLDEHSNVFDLYVEAEQGAKLSLDIEDGCRAHTKEPALEPKDLVRMGLATLKVASYWCSEEDFESFVREYLSANGGQLSYDVGIIDTLNRAKEAT